MAARHDVCARKEKGRAKLTRPLAQSFSQGEAYFEYVRVDAAVVPVVVVDSFFCAQAPRLKALAKTATIMIAFKTLILFSPLS